MKKFSLVSLVLLLVMGLSSIALAAPVSVGQTRGLAVDPYGAPAAQASIWTDKANYRVGESVEIGFSSSVAGYAAIYDYPATGPSQMVWPRSGGPAPIEAGRTYSVPDGQYSITASEPLGTDTLVLVVSQIRADLTMTINLSTFFGLGSRGLTMGDVQGTANSHMSPNGESIYAQCSFGVQAMYTKPVLRIIGGAGARLFVDGTDYGRITGTAMAFEPGTHQLVALLPGMEVELGAITMANNATYDWSLDFRPLH